jgi:hypothetical protein
MAAAALWVLGLTLRHVMSGETRPWERLLDLIDGAGSMLLVGSLAVLIVSAYMSTALP